MGLPSALQPHCLRMSLPHQCGTIAHTGHHHGCSLVMFMETQLFLLLFLFCSLTCAHALCAQLGSSLFREEPLPYLVYQPLPWQIQCVTQSRRSSRDSEVRAGIAVLWHQGM